MPKKYLDKKQTDNGPWFVEEITGLDNGGYNVPNNDNILPNGPQIRGEFEEFEQRDTEKILSRFDTISSLCSYFTNIIVFRCKSITMGYSANRSHAAQLGKKLSSAVAAPPLTKELNIELPMSEFNVAQGIFRKGGRYYFSITLFSLETSTDFFYILILGASNLPLMNFMIHASR